MAIKIDCPRCKQNLLVPSKKAGGYVNCPRCSGRIWVAKDATGSGLQLEATSVAAGEARVPQHDSGAVVPTTPAAVGSSPAPLYGLPELPPDQSMPASVPVAPPVVAAPSAGSPAAQPPWTRPAPSISMQAYVPKPAAASPQPPPPPAPKSARKVARLITAEAAQCSLKPAADGQLPDLQLQEREQDDKSGTQSKGVNPLVLLGALLLCSVMSAVAVFVNLDSGDSASDGQKDAARQYIEQYYFGGGNLDSGELKPYQYHLREARRAHSRGDRKAEEKQYRIVLDMLHSERAKHDRGLTGSLTDDKKLEIPIRTILSGS
jgi:DNA-directed RNA polymerase subunit RPC12/RpoP